MGCYNHKDKDGKVYFIPDCIGAAVFGKHRCTCYNRKGVKMTSAELIQSLKEEVEELKLENEILKKSITNNSI